MIRKKKPRAPNPVVDEKTMELLFREENPVDLDFLKVKIPGTITIEDLVQSPLQDIAVINERINTIGDLVVNPDARYRFRAIVGAFGIKYDDFYKKVQEFIETQRADDYRKERVTTEFTRYIDDIAVAAEKLPVSFGQAQFRSRTLDEAASVFSRMMADGSAPRMFFEYIIELKEKIDSIVAEKSEKEETEIERKAPSWMRRDTNSISYAELKGLIDVNAISRFKGHIQSATAVAAAVSPYLEQAEKAVKERYCEPVIVPKEENCLLIRNGSNPRWRDPVANDTYLDTSHRVEILEGVNNGGKTFDMKKAFYIAIAALSGSWVPAGYAKISLRDKIVLRQKGKGDVISAMQQDCRNVKEATPADGEYWLVGLDETFTSTERRGGMALLYGLVTSVAEQGRSLLIASSHYLGLNEAFNGDGAVVFNHFPFERKAEGRQTEIVFPYTKKTGPLKDFKYAIEVAATKGFDSKILEYAERRIEQRIKQSR